jgi:VanZ family protein
VNPAKHLWKLAGAWAVLIFVLSSIPGRSFPKYKLFSYDKVLHALVYSVLGGLCFLALRRTRPMKTSRLIVLSVLLGTVYGLSDEFHQLFVAGRSADLHDALADCIGALLGASAVAMLLTMKARARVE